MVSMNSELSSGISKADSDVSMIKEGIDELSGNSASMKSSFSDTGRIIEKSVDSQNRLISKTQTLIDTSARLKELSDSGSSSLSAMNCKISDIESRIDRISETLEISNDITEKLGVIAINTSIEAANAGKNGKSFEIIGQGIQKIVRTAE